MALRTILKKDTDEESLRKKSRPVTVFDQRLHNMIDDMIDTLKDSGGVGLAAPQVGIRRRIVVIEKEDGTILELVNPEIIDTQGEQEGLFKFRLVSPSVVNGNLDAGTRVQGV